MVVQLAEDDATSGAPPVISDVTQLVTFEALTGRERPIAHVTWERGLWSLFGEFFLLCGNLFTGSAAHWVCMELFVFQKLRGTAELLAA